MTIEEDKIIFDCLKDIWGCGTDTPYYEDETEKEKLRIKLIKKYTKKLEKAGLRLSQGYWI